MKLRALAVAWIVATFFAGCGTPRKNYRVERSSHFLIRVDGVLDEEGWQLAWRETGLGFPWQDREAPPTEFRALSDEQHFYFAFLAQDADQVIDPGEGENAVARGDRVEIFFTKDPELTDYICLEIDPSGRVLDYKATYYRKFDLEWDLEQLVVASEQTESGYVVEGRIPHAALDAAGLPSLARGEPILTGVFRAEFSRDDSSRILEAWISWMRPDSEEPDFHIPSAFGRLR